MNARTLTLLSLSSLFAVACVDDVGEGRVAAEVVEEAAPAEGAAGEAAEAAPAVEGTQLAVDTSRSRIHALGAKVTATHAVEFDEWTGSITFTGEDVAAFEVTVQMAGLRADRDRLTGHLKNEDFFNVEQWPTASFRSSAVVAEPGPDGATHKVTGDLTMRDTTKTISFPATVEITDTDVSAKTEFVINRQDFGLAYPGRPDDLIQDNVAMTIELTAGRGE